MAPEIIRSLKYDCAVDMWAMGVISYVMMSGYPPFDGETEAEVMGAILAVRCHRILFNFSNVKLTFRYDFSSAEWDDYSADSRDFIRHLILEKPHSRLTASQVHLR
jgi:serine/threonine protein kinase